jgi:hypothetical protein
MTMMRPNGIHWQVEIPQGILPGTMVVFNERPEVLEQEDLERKGLT